MKSFIITNIQLIAEDLYPDYAVWCEDGKIKAVDHAAALNSLQVPQIDGNAGLLAPGFVDLHIHGAGTFLIDQGPESLMAMRRLLPSWGVTSFLPTVCPLPKGKDSVFLQKLTASATRDRSHEGAEILGFHLEGPFLSFPGALPPEAIGLVDPERVEALIAACDPFASVFSIAPDFPGILELLPLMTRTGMPAFITHTAANVKQTQAALNAGARHATHFYDVFYPPAENDPGVRPSGVVEAVLADPRASVDFILDGVHVDPVAVQMALACKGPDRVCLITDANVGAGLPPGTYQFAGDTEVTFTEEGGPARLTEKSHAPGALAGSGLTLDRAVRNAVMLADIGLCQAVRMASANPAKVIGVDHRKGWLRPGYDADLVLLNHDLHVQNTWIGGKKMEKAKNIPQGGDA